MSPGHYEHDHVKLACFTPARGDFRRALDETDISMSYPQAQLLSDLGCQHTNYMPNTRTALPPILLRMSLPSTQQCVRLHVVEVRYVQDELQVGKHNA